MSEPGAQRTVLITGATGALGPAVIRAFEGDGWNIRTLSRKPPGPGTAAAAHRHFAADIANVDVLSRAMDGADAVVHMAALLHVFERSPSVAAEYDRVNVQGTSAVMAAARECSVSKVIALSSIAVYGPHRQMVDEDTKPVPVTRYGISKLEGERAALKTISRDGKPLALVLRLAAVYGPSVKGNYERLVHALARRRFVPVGDGRNTRTLVFEEDAARAIVLAASPPTEAGSTFNVTDGEVHTVAEILSSIARALGRRPPRIRVPARVALVGVTSLEALFRSVGRQSPVTRETLDKYLENVAVSGQRIRRTLGFEPRWSLDAGWQQTIRQLRQEGRL